MRTLTGEQQFALGTYVKLVRASEATTARIHQHLAAARLTTSQFGVLEALLHLGPLCQRDLAAKILRSSGDLTLVIDNLERAGLAVRGRSQADRRYVVVSLTGKGRQVIEEVFARHAEVITAELSVLTSAEQKELGRLCRKLGKQLHDDADHRQG